MRLFYPVNSLVVSRNLWPILLSKIWLFFKFSQTYIKKFLKLREFQICIYFFSSLSGCWVISNFVIFSLNKSCETHLETLLPPGGRNWQLITPYLKYFSIPKCFYYCYSIKMIKSHFSSKALYLFTFSGLPSMGWNM